MSPPSRHPRPLRRGIIVRSHLGLVQIPLLRPTERIFFIAQLFCTSPENRVAEHRESPLHLPRAPTGSRQATLPRGEASAAPFNSRELRSATDRITLRSLSDRWIIVIEVLETTRKERVHEDQPRPLPRWLLRRGNRFCLPDADRSSWIASPGQVCRSSRSLNMR